MTSRGVFVAVLAFTVGWGAAAQTAGPVREFDRIVRDPVAVHGKWTGAIETVIEDLPDGTSRIRRFIQTPEGRRELHLEGADSELACASSATVRGVKAGGAIAARESDIRVNAAADCSPTGEQKIAVLLLSYPGVPSPVTSAFAHSVFFGTTAPSLDHYWREASYGRAWATGDVFGPFALDRAYDCEDSEGVLEAAVRAADSMVDFRQYRYISVVYPAPCGIGRASLGCRTVYSPGDGVVTVGVSWIGGGYFGQSAAAGLTLAAHELGHNFGLNHAAGAAFSGAVLGGWLDAGGHEEYGDFYSLMALSWNVGGRFGLGHYSAPHKARLGWLGAENIRTVEASGSYVLPAYETGGTGVRTLRVRRGAGNDTWIWIEYRQPIGAYDSTLSAFSGQVYNGVLAHYDDPGKTQFEGYTRLLDFTPETPGDIKDAALAVGQTWSDAYSPLTVHIESSSAAGIRVNVQYETGCATLSPAGRWHGGAAGSGTVSVSAPAGCSWHVSPKAPWLTATPASGTGSGAVAYSVQANTTAAQRSAALVIGRQDFVVTQVVGAQPSGCSAIVPVSVIHAPASGLKASIPVATGSGCAWSARSDSAWLQPFPLGGSGAGTVEYTVFPNFSTRARTATLALAGNSVFVNQAAAEGTNAERFVALVYFTFLGRMPSASEIAQQAGALGAGVSRSALAMSFFNTPEFNLGGRFVAGLYVGLLDRDAEYDGWLFQRNAYATGIVTQLQLVRNYLDSDEYKLKFGTPDNSTFVRLLYQHILLRTPTQSEVDYQVANAVIPHGRVQTAANLLNSAEFRAGVGPRLTAFLLYACLLQRDPSSSERALRIAQVQAAAPELATLIGEIVNGPEFRTVVD
jgi:M6 family metalloprotease-like protein